MAAHSAAAPCPACGTLTTCVSDDDNAKTVSGSCPTCGRGMELVLIPQSPHGVGAPGVKPGFHQGQVLQSDVLPEGADSVSEAASTGGVVEFGSNAAAADADPDALRAAPAAGSFGVPASTEHTTLGIVEPTPSGSEAAITDEPARPSWIHVGDEPASPAPNTATPASLSPSSEHGERQG